ncbi:MAG TPA: hypothetical protein D7H74_02110 [Candidatus Poseidoniales archaeon]|nr:MAG TPA: hypothetical protein D7H74_02110 [Candidatus Poseidoniales archaeon]|tara:strand:+ start:1683 stop:2135 length:453 start_codon:yes stop_codon:yes gene_type:complete
MIFIDSILKIIKGFSALCGGLFFFYVGVLHFTDTSWFEPIVPPVFGSARFWVLISGVAEILVGLALMITGLEIFFSSTNYFGRKAGIASALLLVILYPANLYMWIYDIELGDGASLSPTGHILRLLLQIGGIIISLWIADFRYTFPDSNG